MFLLRLENKKQSVKAKPGSCGVGPYAEACATAKAMATRGRRVINANA